MDLIHCLLTTPPFAEHAAAIAADPALQEAITGALLERCLPPLTAAFAEAAAAGVPPNSCDDARTLILAHELLWCAELWPAMMRHVRGPGAAATAKHAALFVATVATLPAEPMTRVLCSDDFVAMHCLAARLLAACYGGLLLPAAAGEAASAGGEDSHSGGSGRSSSAADKTRQAVVWELMALVPHICGALRVLVTSAAMDDLGCLKMQADAVTNYGDCLRQLLYQLAGVPWSAAQLSAWAAAAEAGLRLQPLLQQLHAALQQQPLDSEGRRAVGSLAAQLVLLVWRSSQLKSQNTAGSSGRSGSSSNAQQLQPAEAAALRRQLAQVHMAGCRLAHWMVQQTAAGAPTHLPAIGEALPAWHWLLLGGLCKVLLSLQQLNDNQSGLPAG